MRISDIIKEMKDNLGVAHGIPVYVHDLNQREVDSPEIHIRVTDADPYNDLNSVVQFTVSLMWGWKADQETPLGNPAAWARGYAGVDIAYQLYSLIHNTYYVDDITLILDELNTNTNFAQHDILFGLIAEFDGSIINVEEEGFPIDRINMDINYA